MSKIKSGKAAKISLTVILLGIFAFVVVATLKFNNIKEFITPSKDTGTPMTILDTADCAKAFENSKQTLVQLHIYTDLDGTVFSKDEGDLNDSSIEEGSSAVNPQILNSDVYGSFGSGSIWEYDEDTILIVTNYHVISQVVTKNALGYAVFYNGTIAEFTVTAYDDDADCAFIEVDSSCMTREQLFNLRCVVPYDQDLVTLAAQDTIFVVHSNEIMRSDMVAGNTLDMIADTSYVGYILSPSIYVSALLQDMLYCKCSADAGMSGGPTFDAYGYYIGMLTGATDEDEIVSVLLPDIEAVYEKVGN